MLRRILVRPWRRPCSWPGTRTARAADDPRFAADFVQGLRERGYYDLALEYLDQLRQDPETPADLKKTLDFEEGRTLIEAATHANDPDVSKEKLDQAKVKIEAFVKANPDLPADHRGPGRPGPPALRARADRGRPRRRGPGRRPRRRPSSPRPGAITRTPATPTTGPSSGSTPSSPPTPSSSRPTTPASSSASGSATR